MKKGKSSSKGGKKSKLKRSKSKEKSEYSTKFLKLVREYKADQLKYEQFVSRIDKWFSERLDQIENMFSCLDVKGLGYVTYYEFKAGMLDKQIPCNAVELHILCLLFDSDANNFIDFSEFSKGLLHFRKKEIAKQQLEEAANNPDQSMDANGESNVIMIRSIEQKFVKILFRFLIFNNNNNNNTTTHQYGVFNNSSTNLNAQTERIGDFEEIVRLEAFVYSLAELIKKRKQFAANQVCLYSDNSRSEESILDPQMRLVDLGVRGGTFYEPKEQLVYYDFVPETVATSLISCDHYYSTHYD